MALLFCEGFDNYGNITNLSRGRWFANGGTYSSFPPGRFYGRAFSSTSGSMTFGANLTYCVFGCALKEVSSGSSYSHDLYFADTGSTTKQCVAVNLNASSGILGIYTYNYVGTNWTWVQRAVSLPGMISDATWFYLEVKIDSVNGYIEVRVNGTAVVSYTGSLSATQSGGTFNSFSFSRTVNNYVNLLLLDDMYVLDSTVGPGARPMNDFLGDKRVAPLFPMSNDSVSWTPLSSVTVPGVTGSTQNISIVANRTYIGRYTGTVYDSTGTIRKDQNLAIIAKQNCTLTGFVIRAIVNTPSVHIRPVVYSEDPLNVNQPGALLAKGDELTGLSAGINTLSFGASAPALTKGSKYWFGFIADAAFSMQGALINDSGYQYVTSTYPNAPTTFNWASAAGQTNYEMVIDHIITATNYGMVQEDDADTITYNSTSTLNNQDLFGIGPSISTSAAVYAVQVTGSFKKDDSNARSVANLVKSGTTQAQGASNALNADFKYTSDVWVLNPATGSEWTVAEVNAAKIGYKVTV